MSVTLKDVEHIATLARLEFTDEEKAMFTHQLNSILAYVEQLNKLDTTNVEPLSHVIELDDAYREDVVKPGVTQEDALRNAPAKTDKFFKVPKVIGDR
ncbi:MAG: Asp-tRNA(Asn)/Glu-tRNA(Gln) amidotransferase subunit GatC [Bacteroidota bacterium]|jgi:aspartyl-tRNA(Asn)/glutamyl-tRNA(Gln) amidotransferase subunit C